MSRCFSIHPKFGDAQIPDEDMSLSYITMSRHCDPCLHKRNGPGSRCYLTDMVPAYFPQHRRKAAPKACAGGQLT